MENNNDRVLAYTLAKEVSHDELNEVSGAGFHLTKYTSLRASGGGGYDGSIDFTMDW